MKALKDNELLHILHCGIKGGEKYPENFRNFCLSLNYYSPRAYKHIRSTFNNHLPHPRIIKMWYQNSDVRGEAGIQKDHMEKLGKIAKDFKEKNGYQMTCCLIFDEMNIRQQVFWSLQQLDYIGYTNDNEIYQNDHQNEKNGTKRIVKQAIVFILNGVNTSFEFPVAYYFIDTLDKYQRNRLLDKIVKTVTECGIEITNVTFDGYPSNIGMCELFGAHLTVDSSEFRPYFLNPISNEKIYIILDPSHMEKLFRNTLASKEVIYDDHDNKIEFRYLKSLFEYSKSNNLKTHKLTKKHIDQWDRNKMNVRVAVQTFSDSVADSLEFLMNKNHPEFIGAAPTIRFIRIMNKLFDIFNTRHSKSNNIFKRELSSENKRIVFDFFKTTIKYFSSLKIDEVSYARNKKKINKHRVVKKVTKKLLIQTANKTCARGFIINMVSMMAMYEKYVEQKVIMKTVATYYFLQDVVEIFFGKIRACGGYNNNPNVHQFKGAYKKLMCNIKIMSSEDNSCRVFDSPLPENMHYSNIFFVSSKRAKVIPTELEEYKEKYENQKNDILEKVAAMNGLDSTSNFTATYIASLIEEKIMECPNFYCNSCRLIFEENEKIDSIDTITINWKPCVSTFKICQITEKFFKLYDIQNKDCKFDFRVLYCLILRTMNLNELYENSKFECDIQHKYQFIKCIVLEYISHRATAVSREITYDQYKKVFRQHFTHLITNTGQ